MPRPKTPPYERLWKYINKGKKENDCWSWTGGKNNLGFPMLRGETKKMELAHRIMGKHLGLKGPEIHHLCGTYDCLNPKHLSAGTKLERQRRTFVRHNKNTFLKNDYVICPGCKQRAWSPTIKRYHKDCFSCEEV